MSAAVLHETATEAFHHEIRLPFRPRASLKMRSQYETVQEQLRLARWPQVFVRIDLVATLPSQTSERTPSEAHKVQI